MKNQIRLIVTSVLLFFLVFTDGRAQTTAAYGFLDTNNVKARVSSDGNHFWDYQGLPVQAFSEYEVPKWSNKHTIFTNALWIGGLDSTGQLYLSGQRYRDNGEDYTLGPLSTDGNLSTDPQTINAYNAVWIVSRYQIEQHIAWANDPSSMPGYTTPADILDWPAHGDTTKNQSYYLAPFIDVNGNGKYDPQNGDYPKIRGDQAIYFIFNDAGSPNTETGGIPLGIEVHGMAYAFYCPQSPAFHHAVFMNYKIINRSNRDYHDTYLGLFTDFDIGVSHNDYAGTDVQRGSIFGYNGTAKDSSSQTNHYGLNPPAQSMTILGGPLMDADSIDNPAGQCNESINGLNFGNGVADDERLGLTGSVIFTNTGGGIPQKYTDPEVASEFYCVLNSKWKDSTAISYGDAYDTLSGYGPHTRFMYPGLSDTCNWGTGGVAPNGPQDWTEGSVGNLPFDKRGVGITGPFTFEAGTMEEIDFAFVFGRDLQAPDSVGNMASLERLRLNIDTVRNAFINNTTPCGQPFITSIRRNQQPGRQMKLKLYPNPAQNQLTVEIKYGPGYSYQIYDVYGKLIHSQEVFDSNKFDVDISDLPAGMYFLKVKSDQAEMVRKFLKL